jgi:hypothetical protein
MTSETSVVPTGSAAGRAVSIAESLTSRQWDELTDIVLRRLERGVIDDLSRRGRYTSMRAL